MQETVRQSKQSAHQLEVALAQREAEVKEMESLRECVTSAHICCCSRGCRLRQFWSRYLALKAVFAIAPRSSSTARRSTHLIARRRSIWVAPGAWLQVTLRIG